MALTRRGRTATIVGAVVALLAVGVGAMAVTGHTPAPIRKLADVVGLGSTPPTCPLTGKTLPGGAQPPTHPVLAVKVENTSDAYPLAGLDRADIVYEEVVEGGITRFAAVFDCTSASRVGPVRSARTTDPKILLPFGSHPLLAFSGASGEVLHIVKVAGIVELVEGAPAAAFMRDGSRQVPHNLFTNTAKLWAAGSKLAKDAHAPKAVFGYSNDVPTPNRKGRSATVVFSGLATADWRWQGGRYVRYLDGSPMKLADGAPIATDNVVIQQVKTTQSSLHDVLGYPSPEVGMVGHGKAWVLRDGRLVAGTWSRGTLDGATLFRTKAGEEITLKPGTTYVELAPIGMFNATISFNAKTS
jgi:Protein of unknown function (DUF3048) N-terminal domain/Protein of unknown function (DUF3048) C-terminal domain